MKPFMIITKLRYRLNTCGVPTRHTYIMFYWSNFRVYSGTLLRAIKFLQWLWIECIAMHTPAPAPCPPSRPTQNPSIIIYIFYWKGVISPGRTNFGSRTDIKNVDFVFFLFLQINICNVAVYYFNFRIFFFSLVNECSTGSAATKYQEPIIIQPTTARYESEDGALGIRLLWKYSPITTQYVASCNILLNYRTVNAYITLKYKVIPSIFNGS